jgi:hypothetical protein
MVVMRIDGDCGCHPSSDGDNECGVYRPYYQSYSSDDGQCAPRTVAWTTAGILASALML